MTVFLHKPVLLRETLGLLDLKPGMKVADCTAGGGGHSLAILEHILPSGFLVAIDQDPQAIEAADRSISEGLMRIRQESLSLSGYVEGDKPYTTIHSNFSRIKEIMQDLDINGFDGALMDLGVSSYQLDEGDRGFSYQHPGVLDMRMNPSACGPTAYDVVNDYSAAAIEQILWRFGEERWSRRIAQFIVDERKKAPIRTTDQLVAIIRRAIPAGAREDGPHPAKRSFQAIRIHVNHELDILAQAIEDVVDVLAPEGRLAVITFHSLEDRLVKDTFKKLAAGCICPKDFPVCVCGKVASGKILTSKPVVPTSSEIEENPRARSAKLRAYEKTRGD